MQLHPEKPLAGLLAPLFALRCADDLGVGDLRALRHFIDWAAANGFRLVQLLPVNETGNDHSPYNAISSVAIDPCTLELSPEALPDLAAATRDAVLARFPVASLREGAVQYPQVKALKRALLETAFEAFLGEHWELDANADGVANGDGAAASRPRSPRGEQFRQWRTEQAAWLEGYALFRTLMDENGGSEMWDKWPAGQQTLATAQAWRLAQPAEARAALERKRLFFQYVQWIAFTQWGAVKAEADGKGVALMGDVPIGVSYYSADVFSHPEIFNLPWSGGAPPEPAYKDDPFIEKWGQNWGVPLYRWDALRAGGFAWWRERVRRVRDVFHLFRIDHVLGFYRMYGFPWRPERNAEFAPLSLEEARAKTSGELPHFTPRDDASPENRDANRRDGEEYLRVLLEEVGEHRLIAEDLGVVPDYVRPSLASLGIAGFKVPQWERGADWQLTPGGQYPRLSVTTYATHDHPPLAALWAEKTAAARAGDGHQRWELEQLCGFAGIASPFEAGEGDAFTDKIHEAFLAALLKSHSWLAIVMITDVFGEPTRFNVPGAVAASNWSERIAEPVELWARNPRRVEKMRRITALIRESGRA